MRRYEGRTRVDRGKPEAHGKPRDGKPRTREVHLRPGGDTAFPSGKDLGAGGDPSPGSRVRLSAPERGHTFPSRAEARHCRGPTAPLNKHRHRNGDGEIVSGEARLATATPDRNGDDVSGGYAVRGGDVGPATEKPFPATMDRRRRVVRSRRPRSATVRYARGGRGTPISP